MAVIKTVQEESLVALGDAIREKAGTNEPLVFPTGMIEAIESIETGGGGGGEAEPLVLTGDCAYICSGPIASKHIELFGDKISTKNITGASNMFKNNTLSNIPFEINISKNSKSCATSNMFYSCQRLVRLPKINNLTAYSLDSMFYSCHYLKEVPDDYFDTWDFTKMMNGTSAYSYSMKGLFTNCYSLRKIPVHLFSKANPVSAHSYAYWYFGFQDNYVLDELVNLPLPYTKISSWTSNSFLNSFRNCGRLKTLTFETNADGTPIVMKWKSQTIDLSAVVGYMPYRAQILDYNSGIGADKEVKDDATYQALKNDPDYWTPKPEYSRYNHDSAVATINSLPDCSATGTNAIKFTGAAGSATDGGAINTLTEEEIAVVAAKGWTVSFA